MVVYHQGFCFTVCNYTPAHVKMLKTLQVQLMAFGYEVCPTTGTPHLQGFLWTFEPRTPQQMKRKLKGAWVGVPGSEKPPEYWLIDDGEHDVGYCFKEHYPGWYLWGVVPSLNEFLKQVPKGKGTRCDLLAVKKEIDKGTLPEQLMEDDGHFHAFVRYDKFFNAYSAYKRRRTKFEAPKVIVIHGSTGKNKTRSVYDIVGDNIDNFHKWEPGHGLWFDGYNGQDFVLFDEFRGQIPYGTMLSLLDGYPGTKVQVKGATVLWSPLYIYITSPQSPSEWYPNLAANDKIDQLLRRITTITNVDED